MMGKIVWVLLVVLLFVQAVLAIDGVSVDRLNIWPMPHSVSHGRESLFLSKDFELNTEGTKYNDGSGILKDGFSRLLEMLRVAHVADGNFSKIDTSLLLQGLHVVVLSADDQVLFLFRSWLMFLCGFCLFAFFFLIPHELAFGTG